MKKLSQHILDFNLAFGYFKDKLEGVNTLSSKLFESINFKKGVFFTLLPNDATLTQLHEFEVGGVLPQNPEEEHFTNGNKGTYSIIPTIHDELIELIVNEINKSDLSCVFDDVIRIPSDKNSLYDICGTAYGNEVYYIIKKESSNRKIIEKCLEKSNAFWHSLCVLTKSNFSSIIDKKLTPQIIRDLCNNTQTILVGAYDGEGYVFWEKQKANL